MDNNLYEERDIIQLDVSGNFYCQHVHHMTSESLHSKSDIAAELGYRDFCISELQKDNETLRAMMREVEIQRDALVAENAALKDLQPTREMIRAAHKETEEYDNINLDDDLVVFMWQAMHSKIKTPATDTAIAEIGAQAVEQAAMGFHEKCYAAFEGSDEYGLYIRAELMQFANKLRGGGCE